MAYRTRLRLSDTEAISSRPVRGDKTLGMDSSRSVSVRRIENGYVCCESNCTPEGGYKSREYYSEARPQLETMVSSPGTVGPEGLNEARIALSGSGRKRGGGSSY